MKSPARKKIDDFLSSIPRLRKQDIDRQREPFNDLLRVSRDDDGNINGILGPDGTRESARDALHAERSAIGFEEWIVANPDTASPVTLNPRYIEENLVIPSGFNASAAGPLTINNGVVIDIADNASMTIN